MNAPHGRPKGRQTQTGAAQRRTAVTPSRGEGAGGRVVIALAPPFDLARLEACLAARLPDCGGPVRIEQLAGGQSNPTYRVDAGAWRYVLRCKPGGVLLPSAHAIEREFRVVTALQDSAVPVARTRFLCEDAGVIGTAFYVMDYVEGRIFRDPALPGLDKAERGAIYEEMNRVIAAVHGVDVQALGLGDYGKPGNYLARQIGRWSKQYRAAETERIEAMERLIEWLPAHIPAGDECTLVHGDYRIDNLMFHPTEPRIVALLDWELSTLGHPLADLASHCMVWSTPPGLFRGMAGRDIAALGIPAEAEYVAAYCRRGGRAAIPAPHWEFYMAYSLFRAAAIGQGIVGRVAAGTAASADAREVGGAARRWAEMGWHRVESMLAQQAPHTP